MTHQACFDSWWATLPAEARSERPVDLLDAGFAALWTATRSTLGSVTLVAITHRVLVLAAAEHASFAGVEIDAVLGLDTAALRDAVPAVGPAVLREGTRFVLVQFLTVVGNLTAEILTPELHAALTRVASTPALDRPRP